MDGRKSNEFANLLDKRYKEVALGDILDDAERVRDLLQHPGWVLVADLLDTAYQRGTEDLVRGLKPLEQAEYAHKAGCLNGIRAPFDAAETYRQFAEEVKQKINDSERQAAAERA